MHPQDPMPHRPRRGRRYGEALLLAVLFSPLQGFAQQGSSTLESSEGGTDGTSAYSYVRALEGAASVMSSSAGTTEDAEVRYPILVGDRLRVDSGTWIDVLLSDGAQLTLEGSAEIVFDDLAQSPDGGDAHRLTLIEGRLLLDSRGYWGAETDHLIDTRGARIYLHEDGRYLITVDRYGKTEVVVRHGFAEVVDDHGSTIGRAGDAIEIEDGGRPFVRQAMASAAADFERWADAQEVEVTRAADASLDEPLAGTASLQEHGQWVDVEGQRAWRPRAVTSDWKPYYHGRWTYTPRGLYWISHDPWSPVTYHFGSWSWDSFYGWVWYPGYSFAPAHVYWYWGPEYVAWVPYGYYHRPHRGFHVGIGIYGYIGGHRDRFRDWVFCPTRYVGYHRSDRYYRHGRDFDHDGRFDRGILTTDTRSLNPERWRRPELVRLALERDWQAGASGRELPDVSEALERRSVLEPAIATDRATRVDPARREGASEWVGHRGVSLRPRTATGDAPVVRSPLVRSESRESEARAPRVSAERPEVGSSLRDRLRQAEPIARTSSEPRRVEPPSRVEASRVERVRQSSDPSRPAVREAPAVREPPSSMERSSPVRRVIDRVREVQRSQGEGGSSTQAPTARSSVRSLPTRSTGARPQPVPNATRAAPVRQPAATPTPRVAAPASRASAAPPPRVTRPASEPTPSAPASRVRSTTRTSEPSSTRSSRPAGERRSPPPSRLRRDDDR